MKSKANFLRYFIDTQVVKLVPIEIEKMGASNIHVLYDKPHERFHRLDKTERSELFERLVPQIAELEKVKRGSKLLMSSTSWTKDEDFGILLDALVNLGKGVEPFCLV